MVRARDSARAVAVCFSLSLSLFALLPRGTIFSQVAFVMPRNLPSSGAGTRAPPAASAAGGVRGVRRAAGRRGASVVVVARRAPRAGAATRERRAAAGTTAGRGAAWWEWKEGRGRRESARARKGGGWSGDAPQPRPSFSPQAVGGCAASPCPLGHPTGRSQPLQASPSALAARPTGQGWARLGAGGPRAPGRAPGRGNAGSPLSAMGKRERRRPLPSLDRPTGRSVARLAHLTHPARSAGQDSG